MSRITLRDDTIIIEYDLFTLPTAQHKAGLAGLLLMIQTLEARNILPAPEAEVSATKAIVSFTRESLQIVFDDLYDAQWIETSSKQKWKDKEPKRLEEREIQENGKTRREKVFIYDAVQPKGAFLRALYTEDDGIYVKLWRDMLWSILRGIPATRNVYEERADKKPSSLARDFWTSLEKARLHQGKGKILTESFSSSIFVGAEDANAERVPFRGTVEHNLLLHFWLIVTLIYVPRVSSLEKGIEQGWRIRRDDFGYVLAIPEPSDLNEFLSECRELLKKLDPQPYGFRPRSSVIDLYEEAGLEYLYHFLKNRLAKTKDSFFSLSAVELYHLQKQGNRIRQLNSERLLPKGKTLREYEHLREAWSNPFYKSMRLRNLLDGLRWYERSDGVFHRYPKPLFIYSAEKSPKGIRFFGKDVNAVYSLIQNDLRMSLEGGSMSEDDLDNQLALRIYQLIRTYVNHKTEEKSGTKFKDFQKLRDEKNPKKILYPQEYREAREKVCSDAFLAIRGRRDQDFVEYFTGTVCSVPQYMPETDYLAIAGILMQDWERIKVLSMLALSAHSYLAQPTDKEEVEQL